MIRDVYNNPDRFRKTYWEEIPPVDDNYMYFAGDGESLIYCRSSGRLRSMAYFKFCFPEILCFLRIFAAKLIFNSG